MSLYRICTKPDENENRLGTSRASLSAVSNTVIEKVEFVKKYGMVDCFCIKEIARSIAEKLGLEEDLLSDEVCELIATSCFKNLAQVIDNGRLLMMHARRRRFTVKDFKMGMVRNIDSRVINLPPSLFSSENHSKMDSESPST